MRKLFLILAINMIISPSLAQESDFGIWGSINAHKQLSPKLAGLVEGELRLRDNTKTVDCWSGYAEVSYNLLSFLRTGGGYTIIAYNNRKLENWQTKHRLNVFITVTYRLSNFIFALRERFQQTYTQCNRPLSALRSRIQISYENSSMKIRPYTTLECYHTASAKRMGLEKLRYTIGAQYVVSTSMVFGLYYRLIGYPTRRSENILGVGYSIKL